MLRIGLFLATNLAVIFIASITLQILGLDQALNAEQDGSFTAMLVFFGIIGMGGAFISLLLSKTMAKHGAKVHVIEQARNAEEAWLVATVQELAQKAGIGMPEVGIFPSNQSNAFATGWNRNDALVAVSTGLMRNMNKNEVRAVLGHEIAHIANGDMITLSLLQGVINTFVMIFARIIGGFIDKAILKNEEGHGIAYFAIVMIVQTILGFLASMIVMWFSRYREFRADQGGAYLADKQAMISALKNLQREYDKPNELPEGMLAFGINTSFKEGMMKLFASHPPLEERIARLESQQDF